MAADILRKYFKFPILLVLSAVFLYSAWTKIIDPEYFVISISYYKLFPMSIINASAIFLIFLEALCAVGIWLPAYRRSSALLLAAMLIFFIVIIAVSMARGLDISCGCFGHDSGRVGFKKILENTALLFLAWLTFNKFELMPSKGELSQK